MTKVFERLDLKEEKDLEQFVIEYPDQVEDGLKYIEHQMNIGNKFVDVLCVDRKGILTVIELKVNCDDRMIPQVLEYFDYVTNNKERIAKAHDGINVKVEEEPRIILIASEFSERIKKACRYLMPNMKLMEFEYLSSKGGDKGFYFKEISFDAEPTYEPPIPVDQVLQYISNPKVRRCCEKVIKDLKEVAPKIDQPKGAGENWIRFRYRNRFLADILVRREFFYIKYGRGDEEKWSSPIKKIKDWEKNGNRVYRR